MKTKLKNEKGFTIIEVLIVLAIAGLILLIIFLAVPALQRNSRNTQRKNDVAALLGAVSNYSNNNNGDLPNGCNGTGTINLLDTVSATEIQSEAVLGYYNRLACGTAVPTGAGGVQMAAAFAAVAANTLDTAAEDYVRVIPVAQCDTTTNDNSVDPGGGRSYVAVYEIETGSNRYNQVCQAS